jgi:hypothetical protein
MNVQEMKEQLHFLHQEVARGEVEYKAAQKGIDVARADLEAASIDPDGDIDAQIKGFEIKAERASTKAFAMLKSLQEKLQ